MKSSENTKKHIVIALLVLFNITLILSLVLFAVQYSRNVRLQKEKAQLENFCNTVDTMRQISERYLDAELESAQSWAAFIEKEHMTREEALSYIAALDDQSTAEAHIVDMDTFDAWSTCYTDGSNTVTIYREGAEALEPHTRSNAVRLKNMFYGEKCILSKYRVRESQRVFISVGTRVTLKEADGSDRAYLLLRAIPVDYMKSLWLFPTSFSEAQIGLIATNYDYIIPSTVMRSETFINFVRFYNFENDYFGADKLLSQIKTQRSGLLTLNDSKNQSCYWYYSRLDTFDEADILGYIPVKALADDSSNLSIVYVVAVAMFFLILIDGGYVLSINCRLRAAAVLANQANQSKSQFLSTMSHDIRTPLNAVLGMAELAQARLDDKAYVKDCLAKIMVSGNHLLTLVNDILELSRVESGKISLNPEPFHVRMLVSNLESITRSQVAGHGLSFECVVETLPFENLIGDRLRLTQVYLNLLNNAVKYTKAGGKVRLTVKEENITESGNVTLTCIIEDTGVGMSKELQKTMYESFTRVADGRVDKIQGTGLGLAIVKHMVELMNGDIMCDSELGAGTVFTVRIPLIAATEALPHAVEHIGDENSDLVGLHLLIAEDNDINWEIIFAMLEEYGIVCDRAENGRECVDFLLAAVPGTYDLVFMDLQMPLLNGLQATREIRFSGREDLQTIPIAAMTADAFAEDVQGCMAAGMNAHISKPIQIDKVLSTIRFLVSRPKH